MSQSTTTDGNGEGDESTQSYVDCTQAACSVDQDPYDLIKNWPHDRQPGWSQYPESSQSSLISRVSCSLNEPLTPCSPTTVNQPFYPIQTTSVVVPETPEATQERSVPRMSRPIMSKKDAEEQIQRITDYLERNNYTVFTHKTRMGDYEKTMHLAFFVYDSSNVAGDSNDSH